MRSSLVRAFCCASLLSAAAFGQAVVNFEGASGASTTRQISAVGKTVESDAAAIAPPVAGIPLGRGSVVLHPSGQYHYLHTSGLQARPGSPRSTSVQSISGGVAVASGTTWALAYTARWVSYSDPSFRETIDHTLTFDATVGGADWGMQLSQRFATSDSPMIETASQISQQISSTTWIGIFRATRNISLDFTAKQDLAVIERTPDTYEWSFQTGARYHFSDRIQLGAGVGTGYVLIYRAADMHYYRPLAHLTVRLTDKTTIDLQGGQDEWRLVSKPDRFSNFFYNVSLAYQPFAVTTISASLQQGTSASRLQAQATETHGWRVSVTQRVLKHFQLSVRTGVQQADYLVAGPLTFSRRDKIQSHGLRLSTQFLRHGTAGLFYTRTQNISSVSGFDFSSTQFGGEVGFRF